MSDPFEFHNRMKVLHRLTALGPWLAEAKHVWLASVVTILALLIALLPGLGSSECLIRLTGLSLQVLGTFTVVWGVLTTRAFFGLPPLRRLFIDWLARCPLRNRVVSLKIDSAHHTSTAHALRVHSVLQPAPDATPEVRLEIVEKNVKLIHDRITGCVEDLDQDITSLCRRLSETSAASKQNAVALHQRIEQVATGGLHISAIGAAWLFTGVILSTAAPEIAALLQ